VLRPDTQASRRAWGWLAALLDGASTDWQAWSGEAEPRLPFFPAAQQLEALRRVNAAAAGRPVPPALADALLTDGITDRNRGDLPLAGEEPRAFGPRAVDPGALAAADLLPVVTGPLARALAERPERSAPRPLPWRRSLRLAGDPWLVAQHAHEQRRRRRGRPGGRGLVLAADLATMTLHTWAVHSVTGGRLGLESWLRERLTDQRVPRSLDLAGHARRMATEVGRRHTTIALTDPPAARLAVAPAVDPVAVEVARYVGRPLGVLVTAERRQDLLLHTLLPAATRPAAPLVLPDPWHGLLSAYAVTQRDRLAAAGYPVHGSLDTLLPPEGATTAFPTDRAVLARTIEVLLDPTQGVSR